MKEARKVRSNWLTIRMDEEEERRLKKLYLQTTSSSLSEYARDVLLREPVTIKYRSQSADDFLQEMIGLKKELSAIGNNFNQAVHKLHTMDHDPEIKAWAMMNELGKNLFMRKVDEIQEKMNQIYEQW